MIGDRLVLTGYHRRQAGRILQPLLEMLERIEPLAVSIAGESGSGKTGVAHLLAEMLTGLGIECVILCQDDYFRLPPADNHGRRLEDIGWVGPGEVRMDLMAEHLCRLKLEPEAEFDRPLMNHEENRLEAEGVGRQPVRVILVEGTYVTGLTGVDLRVFLAATYQQTRPYRALRARDSTGDFMEQVLSIEHMFIREQRILADLVLDDEAGSSGCHVVKSTGA